MRSDRIEIASVLLLCAMVQACSPKVDTETVQDSNTHSGESVGTEVEETINLVAPPGFVVVVVILDEYAPIGVADDFSDGTSAVYDLSIFKVIRPDEHAGKEIRIRHVPGSADNTFWRDTGEKFRLTIDARIFDSITHPGTISHVSSLTDIEKLQTEGE